MTQRGNRGPAAAGREIRIAQPGCWEKPNGYCRVY